MLINQLDVSNYTYQPITIDCCLNSCIKLVYGIYITWRITKSLKHRIQITRVTCTNDNIIQRKNLYKFLYFVQRLLATLTLPTQIVQ